MKRNLTLLRLTAALCSALLLAPGWLSGSGFTLPFALVPLLWIQASYDQSHKAWWGVLGWSSLTFILWNALTVWWIWFATPVGPIAATMVSTFWNLVAFMTFHTITRKAGKLPGYTALVATWIATEYIYTHNDFSWPWLILGNGFSHDVWAVQWYEYTGVFGGSLWVLLCNILLFEAWRERNNIRRWVRVAAILFLPLGVSLWLWHREGVRLQEEQPTAKVSIIQPNVDCYEKFNGDDEAQINHLHRLLAGVPADADFIFLPETAIPGFYIEPSMAEAFSLPLWMRRVMEDEEQMSPVWERLVDSLRSAHPQALLVTGANTVQIYGSLPATRTARQRGGVWFDHFNSAVGVDSTAHTQIHHKGRLVIGVENTPTWIFDLMNFLVIDLGGIAGQIGVGQHGTVFTHRDHTLGSAICYEGLYGEFFGEFVQRGAQFMAIISNDGWWKDTPGYRHLFTISRLRAIEQRRAVARSANTGRSGFISPRGDIGETLGWEETGVLTAEIPLENSTTFYNRYGDYIGRIACFLTLLSVLYTIAYCVKRKNYLVP